MKTKKQLFAAFMDNRVRRFLELDITRDKLLQSLQAMLYPEEFISNVMDLLSLKQNSPEKFEAIVASYQNTILKRKIDPLTRLLTFLLRILNLQAYTYAGETITAKKLAQLLFAPFDTDEVQYEFSVGNYRAEVKMGIKKMEEESPFCSVKIYRGEDLILQESSTLLSRWNSILNPRLEKLVHCFDLLLGKIGSHGMHLSMSEKLSFVGFAITDESQKAEKQTPVWFKKKREEINDYIRNGDLTSLKKILKKEYRKQRKNILPEAMKILHDFGERLIRDCKRHMRVNDPSVGILQKIHSEVILGWYSVMEIPNVEGIEANTEKKNFLLAYRDEYQVKMIAKVLGRAGWGGSLLIGSYNFPSIYEALQSQQVDYLVQSSLGSFHEKDLYEEELDGTSYADAWKGKVLKCEISDDSAEAHYAEHFTKEKIVKFHYQAPQQEAVVA